MAEATIRVLVTPGEQRAAAMGGGGLLDVAIHRPGAPPGVGARYRGRVIAHLPAMAGAFVALPGGIEGFLPDSQGGQRTAGEAVTVVITRAAQSGKGPRLSALTEQAGAGAPALLHVGPDAVERLLTLHPGAELADGWPEPVAAAFDALADPVAALPGGLRATITPTPALVAIDVDMGTLSGERRPKASAQREANRAALPALAHQIRLRNLSGAIVIDLAGMPARARAGLAPDLVAALVPDPLAPRFLGFTALGFAEIQRPRVHPPLHELLSGAHAAGLAALGALDRQAAADPATALRLVAAPDVVSALEADGVARAALAHRTGRPLMMRSDPALPPGRWTTEPIPRA